MIIFTFLKYVHIAGAAILVGSVLTIDLVTLRLILSGKNPGLKIFYNESKFIERAIICPGALITAVSGIIMAQLWFGWPFWLIWGLVVVIFTGVTGSMIIPRLKKQLTDLISSGSSDHQLRVRRLTMKFIFWISLDSVLLLSAVGTMVYKPVF